MNMYFSAFSVHAYGFRLQKWLLHHLTSFAAWVEISFLFFLFFLLFLLFLATTNTMNVYTVYTGIGFTFKSYFIGISNISFFRSIRLHALAQYCHWIINNKNKQMQQLHWGMMGQDKKKKRKENAIVEFCRIHFRYT